MHVIIFSILFRSETRYLGILMGFMGDFSAWIFNNDVCAWIFSNDLSAWLFSNDLYACIFSKWCFVGRFKFMNIERKML